MIHFGFWIVGQADAHVVLDLAFFRVIFRMSAAVVAEFEDEAHLNTVVISGLLHALEHSTYTYLKLGFYPVLVCPVF